MRSRCRNNGHRQYKDFGGRGIEVDPVWDNNFAAFVHYVYDNLGPKPSDKHILARIDVNKNYAPGNMAWSTRTEINLRKRLPTAYSGKPISSSHRCVHWNSFTKRWVAVVDRYGKRYNIGSSYRTEEAAAKAVEEFMKTNKDI
jgi:hypothetical protein